MAHHEEPDVTEAVLPDGTVLDADDLDRVADEAEAPIPDDADVRVVGRLGDLRRPGRPSLTGKPAVSPRVQFRVTPEQRDQLQAIADREHKSVSEVAREAVEERLARA